MPRHNRGPGEAEDCISDDEEQARLRIASARSWRRGLGGGTPGTFRFSVISWRKSMPLSTGSVLTITTSPGNVIERALEQLPLRHRRAMSSNEFQVRILADSFDVSEEVAACIAIR